MDPAGVCPLGTRSPPPRKRNLVELHQAGRYTGAELAELFSVARATVYRAIRRAQGNTRAAVASDTAT